MFTSFRTCPSFTGYFPRIALTCALAVGATIFVQQRPAFADEAGYQLGPQDKIRVSVIEWFNGAGELRSPVNGEYTVSPNGFVSLPLLGEVKALGVQAPALAADVSAKLQAKLALSERPNTSVEIIQFRPFFVMGDLERPGEYAYRPGITALQAVSLAGGFYRDPSARQVQSQLEAVQTAGERRSLATRVIELAARRARLEAELKNADAIDFPAELVSRKADPSVATAMSLEGTIFEARRRAFVASVNAQKKLIELLQREAVALKSQSDGLARHEDATKQQGDNLRTLQARGLATMGREFDIDRLLADVAIRRQEIDARALRLQQELVKTEDAIQGADARRKQEIVGELQTLQVTFDDLERRLLLADQTLNGTVLSPARTTRPSFKVVRLELSGKEIELPATTSTPLKPGDILVVQMERSDKPMKEATSEGGRNREVTSASETKTTPSNPALKEASATR